MYNVETIKCKTKLALSLKASLPVLNIAYLSNLLIFMNGQGYDLLGRPFFIHCRFAVLEKSYLNKLIVWDFAWSLLIEKIRKQQSRSLHFICDVAWFVIWPFRDLGESVYICKNKKHKDPGSQSLCIFSPDDSLNAFDRSVTTPSRSSDHRNIVGFIRLLYPVIASVNVD